jgi:UDP-2-acetamido-3-amino-2,3-dideoxy-glucuronate N-acetyltransferase
MEGIKPFIGLIGAGYWGKNILRNLCEVGVLRTLCDTDQTLLNGYRKKYQSITVTTSFKDILADKAIKAVAIATPASTHYELTKATLEADKDVFVEKPLALNVQDGRALVELAQDKARILMVGHILHYHPAVIKLKGLIKEGKLGKIQYIYSNRLNIGKLRTEENILWSFAPHDISVILALLEEEPTQVTAFGGDYLSDSVYDVTLTTLEFSNQVKAHIFVSWLHPFKEQKLIVVGSKAMAVFDDVSEEKLRIYPHKIEWKGGKIPVAQKADYYPIEVERKEPLQEELRHFVGCVLEGSRPRTDGEEGLRVLRILEEAERALANGQDSKLPNKTVGGEYFIHESVFVDKDTQIGRGTKIWHFTHILRDSTIGEDCIIGQNVMIGPEVTIGNRCKVQNNVSLYKGVILEDEVFCGPSCVFTNVYNPRAFIERKHEFRPIRVRKGATIGANATIICGNTIGSYAMVAAGAVVTKDVPDHALVMGVPATQVGWVCQCGTTLKFKNDSAYCDYCNRRYALSDTGLDEIERLDGRSNNSCNRRGKQC